MYTYTFICKCEATECGCVCVRVCVCVCVCVCVQGGGGPQTLREMAMNEQAMEGYGRPDMRGGMVGALPPWAAMAREPEGYAVFSPSPRFCISLPCERTHVSHTRTRTLLDLFLTLAREYCWVRARAWRCRVCVCVCVCVCIPCAVS